MAEEGKTYIAPKLIKSPKTSLINVWCEKCNAAADYFISYETPAHMRVSHHGDEAKIGIEDIEGFLEGMRQYRGAGGMRLPVFEIPKPDDPTAI
jgi:hypothetical protein